MVVVAVSAWAALPDYTDGLLLLPSGSARVAFEVMSTEPVRVDVAFGNRVGSFAHEAGTVAYMVPLPRGVAGERLSVSTDPEAMLEAVDSNRGGVEVYPGWRPRGDVEVLPPTEKTQGSPAEATVDETDTYGVRIFGVPVRMAPRVDAPIMATVYHGTRLVAECWADGDRVTNGFDHEDFDDDTAYESTLWFRVDVPAEGSGFIPDARFSRTAATGRLGLEACTG